jgi:hypothetical protein
MIKGIMGSQGVVVNGGSTSLPYVNMSSGPMDNPMQGMLRLYGSDMQVYNGSSWMNIGTSYATVELTGEVQSIIQWAREQKQKQADRESRIKNNPALQKAFENIKRAEENFDLIDALVKDYIHDEEVTQGP